jgi:hypothetical protein
LLEGLGEDILGYSRGLLDGVSKNEGSAEDKRHLEEEIRGAASIEMLMEARKLGRWKTSGLGMRRRREISRSPSRQLCLSFLHPNTKITVEYVDGDLVASRLMRGRRW